MRTSWRAGVARFLLGGLTGAAAKLVALWAGELPALGLLGSTSLAFVLAASLFGWPGLAGATVLHAVWATIRGSGTTYVLLTATVYVAAGALVLLTFQRVERIGRGMPNFRSFVAFALAAAAGAVLTGTAISLAFADDWKIAAVWIRSTVVTVVVLGPPLLIAGERALRPWLAPVPGEVPARRRPNLALQPERAGDGVPSVVELASPSVARDGLLGLAMVLVVSLLTIWTGQSLAASSFWLGLLYLVPILWSCRGHGLRGGLVTAGVSGLAFLGVEAITSGSFSPEIRRLHELATYAYPLVFVAVGAVVGASREREAELQEHLLESNRRLRSDLQRVARALSSAVEAKDLYTEGHLQRVSAFAVDVGRLLGLGSKDLELLQIASALHDVGKIGIPEQILNKPGPLDPDERDVVQQHPAIGARILGNVEGLDRAAPMVLHHQERWDGCRDGRFPGYPHGLAGDEIPLGARIIAVVDAFDAMTTDRSYRPAMSIDRATRLLEEEAGKQFDPQVVRAFLEILRRRPWDGPAA